MTADYDGDEVDLEGLHLRLGRPGHGLGDRRRKPSRGAVVVKALGPMNFRRRLDCWALSHIPIVIRTVEVNDFAPVLVAARPGVIERTFVKFPHGSPIMQP